MKKSMVFVLVSFLLIACHSSVSRGYKVLNYPQCFTEEGYPLLEFKGNYIQLIKTSDGYSYGPFKPRVSRKITADEIILAIVSCSKQQIDLPNNLKDIIKQLTDDHVPTVCTGQKTIIHQRLKAKKSERATALGYKGYFLYPKIDLACEKGKIIQKDNYSIGQISGSFNEAVEAYVMKHDKFPLSSSDLVKENLIDPLPKDPWGNPFVIQVKEIEKTGKSKSTHSLHLITKGSDERLNTPDDYEVCRLNAHFSEEKHRRGISSSSFTYGFKGLLIAPYGDYKAFLKSRGIE